MYKKFVHDRRPRSYCGCSEMTAMRVWRVANRALALVAAAVIAGGCSSSNNDVSCTNYALAPPQLVIPAPASTSVATNVASIIVGSPADGAFTLQGPSGAALPIGPATAVPSPLPAGIPTSNPASFFHAIPVPTLSPRTTYAVNYAAATGPPPCGSHETSGAIGSFTTR